MAPASPPEPTPVGLPGPLGPHAGRPVRVLILGAGGRDFHVFNTAFRENPGYRVAAFTAAQIPGIAGRRYPAVLAGRGYPRGIPIEDEADLERIIRRRRIDVAILAYSDLAHAEVMHLASRVLAAGASFSLLGPEATALTAAIPVIAVCAVRTGAGKSPVSRFVVRWALERGLRPAVVRHPMPYGDLARQAAQRFATRADLDAADCTIEEREEYEPYLRMGVPVHAGVDYARVIAQAQAGADVLVWDGGNNDLPFVRPDLHIVLADALRAGHEAAYHPGEANARMADVLLITKAGGVSRRRLTSQRRGLRALNPRAPVLTAGLAVQVAPGAVAPGAPVLVVEDGPTLTHGGMPSGAGAVAAQTLGAQVCDPRPHAVGSVRETLAAHPHIGPALPAVGYSSQQVADLEASLRAAIEATGAAAVLDGSPVDLGALVRVGVPIVPVGYELAPHGPGLVRALEHFAARHRL